MGQLTGTLDNMRPVVTGQSVRAEKSQVTGTLDNMIPVVTGQSVKADKSQVPGTLEFMESLGLAEWCGMVLYWPGNL